MLRGWFADLRKVQERKQSRKRVYESEVLAVRMKLVRQMRGGAGK